MFIVQNQLIMTDIDTINRLKSLYGESPVNNLFFNIIARRKNKASITKVDRILGLMLNEDENVNRGEIVRLMQELDALGFGRFVPGRHSKPSRMEWSVDVRELAKAAMGESETVSEVQPGELDDDHEEDTDCDVLEHKFYLRSDCLVSIKLPVDLTAAEADRLAGFLKSLPIESGKDL
ncbi:hypothetical protein DB345_04855 [Spartobacteria bacterium LR76]|nr:hypothetical protein DB345_04855 [Spartobacteria bacterium LR76]